jgi:DNA primase
MSVIDDIKQKADIVEVVSEYTTLQKAGRSFRALCPFHSEKHPSFFVFPEQQSWHCFGSCAAGGDVFSFLMRKEGIDFGEALRLLAERTGIPLAPKPQNEKGERPYQINKVAADYYHQLLLHSAEAEGARNYLAKRGVSPKSISDFRLGFSPDSWQALHQHLTQMGYEEKDLVMVGLVVEREGGGSYDRFRNRLMFPIGDPQGHVVGFGARALDTSLPKYLNSPQTAIFDKSSILYGIDLAKTSIRRQDMAVIVEGYTDVITAHQNGILNVVASMGTALTEKQVGILKKLSKNIVLALDADAAGEEATWRGVETVTRALDQKVVLVPTWRGIVKYENALDADVLVITLPPGKDPDDIIREDAKAWQSLVDGALPVVEYIFDAVSSKLDLTQAKDKSSAVGRLLPLVAEMKDLVRQSHYLQKLARLVDMDERLLEAAMKRLQPDKRKSKLVEEPQPSVPPLAFTSPVEEYCLALLLQHPELKESSQGLLPEYFEESKNRQLFIAWQQATDIMSLRSDPDFVLQEQLDSLLAKVLPPIVHREHVLADCILRLREKFLRSLKTKEKVVNLMGIQGVEGTELAKLQERAIEISTQLGEVFIERGGQRKLAPKE